MKNKLLSLLLVGAMAASMLAGCGSEHQEESKVPQKSEEKTQEKFEEQSEEVVEEEKAGTLAEDMDLSELTFGKYKIDTSYDYSGERYRRFDGLEYTRVVYVSGELPEGQTIDDNARVWYEEMNTGMKAKTLWSASGEAYSTKLSTAISSGDIPDLLCVDFKQYQALVEADLLADLTDEILNGPHPILQACYAAADNAALEAVTIGGRIYGIPTTYPDFNNSNFVYIRKDWMEKLGLEEPKTYDDLADIARAFMESDLDGNGKDDTYGIPCLPSYQTNTGGEGSLGEVFLNVGGAAPRIWQKEDGKVIYGSLMDGAKDALIMLNDWYTEGIIPKDFATWDEETLKQVYADNKAGIHLGTMVASRTTLTASIELNPDAQWQCFLLTEEEGEKVRSIAGDPVVNIYVVRKDFEVPEAFVYMADLAIDKAFKVDPETFVESELHGISTNYIPMMCNELPSKWIDIFREGYEGIHVTKELTNLEELQAKVNEISYGIYTSIVQLDWQFSRVMPVQQAIAEGRNPREAVSTEEGMDANTTYFWYVYLNEAFPVRAYADPEPVRTVFQGVTKSMEDYDTFLKGFEQEAYTKMIMGDTDGMSVSDYFDAFVEDYLSQGGDEITAEVQAMVGE